MYLYDDGNLRIDTETAYDANELFEALKKEHIYVRHWNSERISQYLRITIGTKEEMEALFSFLETCLNR